MNNTFSYLIGIIVLVAIIGAGYFYFSGNVSSPVAIVEQETQFNDSSTTTPSENTPGGDSVTPQGEPAATASTSASLPQTVTVRYTSSGFTPKTITIKAGDTVSFVSDVGEMWVGADEHPSHTGYDSTTRGTHCAAGYTGEKPFDQCSRGETFSFTFEKVGTWDYHDHIKAANEGSVIVTK